MLLSIFSDALNIFSKIKEDVEIVYVYFGTKFYAHNLLIGYSLEFINSCTTTKKFKSYISLALYNRNFSFSIVIIISFLNQC